MCGIVLQCVAREYNDNELAFRDIMGLGRELIISADWQYQMVDPLDERAYLASAKEFLQFFSSMPSDKLSKYKNEILDAIKEINLRLDMIMIDGNGDLVIVENKYGNKLRRKCRSFFFEIVLTKSM